MENDYSNEVKRIYDTCRLAPQTLNEEYVVRAGVVVERYYPPREPLEAFKVLISLNLLNAAVKQQWGPHVVTYGYIKGMAANLLAWLIENPMQGVAVYWDAVERIAYFHVLGVQVSFHYLPMTRRLMHLVSKAFLVPQQWAGMQLQSVAVELFRLAMPDGVIYNKYDEMYARYAMLHFVTDPKSRVDKEKPKKVRAADGGRRNPEVPFVEHKLESLYAATHFRIWQQNIFTLWRRKDERAMPVMRYDGTNYRMIMDYLLGDHSRIIRRSRKTMEQGKLYFVSPQKRVCCINRSNYIMQLTQNCYLRCGDHYLNLCISYGIARYLAFLHPELKFVCTLNYNHRCEQRRYYTYNDLSRVPLFAEERRLKVWIVVDTGHVLEDFDPLSLPQVLVDDYLATEDYYQEFEVLHSPEGRKGLLAYRHYRLLEPVYRDIRLVNYHAQVMGDNGLWAIYSLGDERFNSDFVYSRIWYDSWRAELLALEDGKEVVLFKFPLSKPLHADWPPPLSSYM